jgi:xylulokinase
LGLISFREVPGCVEVQATYLPRPEASRVYDPLFREFVRIYESNRGIFRRLNASRRGNG